MLLSLAKFYKETSHDSSARIIKPFYSSCKTPQNHDNLSNSLINVVKLDASSDRLYCINVKNGQIATRGKCTIITIAHAVWDQMTWELDQWNAN